MEGEFIDPLDPHFYEYLAASLMCVTSIALAAGMTLGYLSLDVMKLKIKLELGTEDEKAAVEAILVLLKDRHLLLCTLLVFNVIAAETLPIFMDSLVPPWFAIILSVTAVLLCGEVLPAAIFTGPAQLAIARRLAPFGRFLLIIFFPLAYPLARMLDYLVGVEDEELMTRDELMTMIRLTRSLAIQKLDKDAKRDRDSEKNEPSSINSRGEILMPSEVDAITGILTLTKKTVRDLMVPMEVVHMVSTDQVLDSATLSTIDRIGHSRLPVFRGSDRNFITGFLFVKKLITCTPNMLLGSCPAIRTPIYIDSSRSLFEVFDMFQTGKSHIAIVSHNVTKLLNVFYSNNQSPTPDCAPCGILTIEDIIEAILQEQIYDEEDETRNSISPTAMTSVLRALRKRGGGDQEPVLMRARSNTNTSFSSNLSGKNEGKASQRDIFRRTYSTTAANIQEQHALGNDFKITGTQSLLPNGEKSRSDSTSRPSEDYFVPSPMRDSRL